MSGSNKRYCLGFWLFIGGAAGMAEYITSGRGVFMVSAIIFSVGLGLIISSYFKFK